MRTVEFNKLKDQNFLSIGNDCVEIDFKSGVHIITGINKDREDRRNGVGKSAIADAVHFAVFGNTIRDIRKEDIINKVNRKNCCVEFEFSTTENNSTQNIRIVRTLQPSKCWLYIDDEDMTRDSIANTNRFIQKKLKTTPDIFQNCVIMTINATTPFLAKNKGEKRKFIESIFNLKIFSDMADILKEELADTRRDSEVQFTRVEGLEENYITQQKQYDSLLTERSERDKKL